MTQPTETGPDAGPPEARPDRPPAWLLTRVTALFLAVLLPVQFYAVVVRDDVGHTTFATVTERFAAPWWPALEWVTLVLALVHGTLVLRDRLARRLGPRRAAVPAAAVTAVAVALGLGATWGLVTFA